MYCRVLMLCYVVMCNVVMECPTSYYLLVALLRRLISHLSLRRRDVEMLSSFKRR